MHPRPGCGSPPPPPGPQKKKETQPIRPGVADAVSLPGWSDSDLILFQFLFFLADLEQPSSLKNKIDFVRALVGMGVLGLAGLEAIEIAKQPFGFEEAVFFHFIRPKLHGLNDAFELLHIPFRQNLY